MNDLVLSCRDLVKTYPGPPEVRALDGVSIDVQRGEAVAVVGPSGSGKSTLLQIAGTLDRPTAGTVEVAGFDVATLSDRDLSALRVRQIGFVFQQFFLLEGESALDNVADGLLYAGVPATERRDRAWTALERVGLAHRASHSARKLSGGERQRVAVARALVGGPALVFADEPTGNLDSRTSEEIVELLESLHAEGVTLIVITHNPEIAGRLPRQVGIRDGRTEFDERRDDATDPARVPTR